MVGDEIWPDYVIEVEPQPTTGGRIVWEWHVWDHVVQDFDKNKPNHGVVAEHPELVDLNYRRVAPRETPDEIERLRALGYIGGRQSEEEEDDGRPPRRGPRGPDMHADWCHTNSIAFNAELDQIALSVHGFNEIWIIDHSTTTTEAVGHTGGRYGKGGDLLYRWGNPRAYAAGDERDQQLFAQHDIRWIPAGMPGAGHLMMFNNGGGRPDGRYSSVVEVAPPIDSSGSYTLQPGEAFGPAKPCWEYAAANKPDFFSHSVSGAQRLANGNTLICSGEQGRVFEVTTDAKIVWDYVNPYIEARRPEADGWSPRLGGRRSSPAGGAFGPGAADGARRPDGPASRPWGRRGRDAGTAGPGGRRGPPGGGPGGPPGGGVFRATRLAPDHPGVQRVLGAVGRNQRRT